MKEFAVIDRFFTPRSQPRIDVDLGVGDDCALLKAPADKRLAMTIDTLVENVHFLPSMPAKALGHKALAVSFSDLAAMGAEPAWVMGVLSLPVVDEQWLDEFCQGFFALLNQYSCQLIGGDTTAGPLAVTTQATGFLPEDLALTRRGAKAGDGIFVTGKLGDGGLALAALKNRISLPVAAREEVIEKLYFPMPRVAEGQSLLALATSAIDISDGLAADLSHIVKQSAVGAEIYAEKLPLSQVMGEHVAKVNAWSFALSAGDDYELCYTLPGGVDNPIKDSVQIGEIVMGDSLSVFDDQGQQLQLEHLGYQHFE